MRLPANGLTACFVRLAGTSSLAVALSACGIMGGGSSSTGALPLATAQMIGPQADYPVVVGEPYAIAGTAYTPEDVMNYDAVGFLVADGAGSGVSGSHHTLPLPSYVEVTSLETGKTILVRLERRGPMAGQELIGLSAGALAQLEAASGTPVRVRRVNPPEDQRALLRAGVPAMPRMDTPMPLVEILKRKLPGQGAMALPQLAVVNTAPPPSLVPVRAEGTPPLPPLDASAPPPVQLVPRPVQPPTGDFIVQAAAFSSSDRADSAANALGGAVTRSGKYFRVRTGPFASRAEAEASLAKVRAAGYSDARILTSG